MERLKKKRALEFSGTDEQERELRSYIRGCCEKSDKLLPVMQKGQEIYGYLPYEVQKIISEELRIPLSDIYSAATFYSDFLLNPRGKYKITICLGTACHLNGSDVSFEKLKEILGIDVDECTQDRLFSIEQRHCVGACSIGPVMMVNDTVYGKITPEKVEQIIKIYREREKAVEGKA